MARQKPSLSHPKRRSSHPPACFGSNRAIPRLPRGAKGAQSSSPRPSSLTVFGLNRRVAPLKGARKGLELRAPGRAHRADGGSRGSRDRDPVGPLGSPVCEIEKKGEAEPFAPKRENLAYRWANGTPKGADGSRISARVELVRPVTAIGATTPSRALSAPLHTLYAPLQSPPHHLGGLTPVSSSDFKALSRRSTPAGATRESLDQLW